MVEGGRDTGTEDDNLVVGLLIDGHVKPGSVDNVLGKDCDIVDGLPGSDVDETHDGFDKGTEDDNFVVGLLTDGHVKPGRVGSVVDKGCDIVDSLVGGDVDETQDGFETGMEDVDLVVGTLIDGHVKPGRVVNVLDKDTDIVDRLLGTHDDGIHDGVDTDEPRLVVEGTDGIDCDEKLNPDVCVDNGGNELNDIGGRTGIPPALVIVLTRVLEDRLDSYVKREELPGDGKEET